MPQTWERALDEYQYPVRLGEFKDHDMYPGWFKCDTSNGDRTRTIEFEERFRRLAPDHLEVWYEAVFWKLYTTKQFRQKTTQDVILRLTDDRDAAKRLWETCSNYMDAPSPERRKFEKFRQNLFGSGVAIAATFPAFMRPEQFPMVDTHIAAWSQTNGIEHGLLPTPYGAEKRVHERHWDFVEAWIKWCRHTAAILTQQTGKHWRTRDVEMAVFTAQRSQKSRSPRARLMLHPLTYPARNSHQINQGRVSNPPPNVPHEAR